LFCITREPFGKIVPELVLSALVGVPVTAELSKTLGREVLAPPHEIYSLNGKGTNGLLREGEKLYLEPAQLLFNDYYSNENP